MEDSYRELFYSILKLLNNRDELSLNQMGYSEQTEKTN